MPNDLNQCNFIGRLGKDAEMRYLPDGKAVATISIAVGEQWKDQQGQKQERTEWVRVSAFGRLAEVMGEYLRKGSKVFISGKLKTRKWQGQDGQDRYTTEIVAKEMQMLDSRSDQAPVPQQGGHQQPQQAPAAQQPAAQPQTHQNAPQGPAHAPPPAFDNFDDSIPF